MVRSRRDKSHTTVTIKELNDLGYTDIKVTHERLRIQGEFTMFGFGNKENLTEEDKQCILHLNEKFNIIYYRKPSTLSEKGGKTIVSMTTPGGYFVMGSCECSIKQNYHRVHGLKTCLGRIFKKRMGTVNINAEELKKLRESKYQQ